MPETNASSNKAWPHYLRNWSHSCLAAFLSKQTGQKDGTTDQTPVPMQL